MVELKQDLRQYNSEASPVMVYSFKKSSYDYLTNLNTAMGRNEIVLMNFIFFNLYYHSKYGTDVFNNVTTCDETSMGILDKLKGII